MANLTKTLKGKRTYTALAAAGVAWAASVAIKHGIDLGPVSDSLTDLLTFVLLGVAAWARSAATDTQK